MKLIYSHLPTDSRVCSFVNVCLISEKGNERVTGRRALSFRICDPRKRDACGYAEGAVPCPVALRISTDVPLLAAV